MLVHTDGGSGRRSRYEKRNASGHSLNDEQALGDSDRGGAKLTFRRVHGGCDTKEDPPFGVAVSSAAMRIDAGLSGQLDKVADRARDLEALGYDGAFTTETSHDPFLPLVLAAEHTERMELGTSIAVAFARTPMTLAMTANDLQTCSGGRFILGLGSQIKPHIERRFSMPWSRPAARMREFVLAMRAIWSSWNDGTKLDFRGDFYTHTLMTPFFVSPPARVRPAQGVPRRRRAGS